MVPPHGRAWRGRAATVTSLAFTLAADPGRTLVRRPRPRRAAASELVRYDKIISAERATGPAAVTLRARRVRRRAHLARAFRKLYIDSRAQLPAALSR